MSELSRRAAEIANQQSANEQRFRVEAAAAEARRAAERHISEQHAAEFIRKLLQAHIPTLPVYGRATRQLPGNIMRERTVTTEYKFAAEGWVIQEKEYDYDDPKDGLALTIEGQTYRCNGTQTQPPDEILYTGPIPFTVADSTVDGVPSIGGYSWLEAPYATDQGLTILARKLVELHLL